MSHPLSPCELLRRFREQCRRSISFWDDTPPVVGGPADLAPAAEQSAVGDQADLFGKTVQPAPPLQISPAGTSAEGELASAVQRLDRPARARGLTAVLFRQTTVTSGVVATLMPGDPRRRAFWIEPASTTLTVHWDARGLNTANPCGIQLDHLQTAPYIFTEEDWGVLIQLEWYYHDVAGNAYVRIWEEVYLT